jgi:hypothetical protein
MAWAAGWACEWQSLEVRACLPETPSYMSIPWRHIPSMRTLTRFVAAVVTAAVVPACSVIASSAAHADPVATTATEYLDKADGWDYSVPAW